MKTFFLLLTYLSLPALWTCAERGQSPPSFHAFHGQILGDWLGISALITGQRICTGDSTRLSFIGDSSYTASFSFQKYLSGGILFDSVYTVNQQGTLSVDDLQYHYDFSSYWTGILILKPAGGSPWGGAFTYFDNSTTFSFGSNGFFQFPLVFSDGTQLILLSLSRPKKNSSCD